MEREMEIKAYICLEKRATPKFQAQGMSIQFQDQDMDPYSNLKLSLESLESLEKRATPKFQAQGMSIQFHDQGMSIQFHDQDMDPYSNLKLYICLEKRATPKFQAQGMSIQFHDQGMDPYSNLKLEIIGGSGKLGVHASAAAAVRASKLKLQSSKPEKEYV